MKSKQISCCLPFLVTITLGRQQLICFDFVWQLLAIPPLLLYSLGFLSYSGMILLNPPTSFEENRLENFVKLPEFTLCPYGQHEPIESFEDVIIKIEDTKKKYSARLKWGNSFENMWVEIEITAKHISKTAS